MYKVAQMSDDISSGFVLSALIINCQVHAPNICPQAFRHCLTLQDIPIRSKCSGNITRIVMPQVWEIHGTILIHLLHQLSAQTENIFAYRNVITWYLPSLAFQKIILLACTHSTVRVQTHGCIWSECVCVVVCDVYTISERVSNIRLSKQ